MRLAERERALTPPYGGVFVPRTTVMDADDVRRATWRMAHEIIERNHGIDDVVLVGLQTGGVPDRRPAGRGHRLGDRGDGPGRHPRRGLLPRRHRTPAGPARGGDRDPGGSDRPDRGPRRRRAVHRPDDAGRPQRPDRLRPGPGRAAGRDGRPGPPGAADPARLRGQEPADPSRRDGRRERGRRRASATWCPSDLDTATCSRSPTSAPTGSRRSCASPTASSR